jgi:hypothetical protein
MKDIIKSHLEVITKESFQNWLENETFNVYASSTSKNGFTELGTDGRGNCAVRITNKKGRDTYFHDNSDKAIEAYKKELTH